MMMNTTEQKALDLALAEIAKMEKESQALNQSESLSLYEMMQKSILEKKNQTKPLE